MWGLLLLIVLFHVLIIYAGASINLTYILKREKNHVQPSCIAEELERYAAVGWIFPIPTNVEGLPNITTKYIPTINSDYNCKFSKQDLCNVRWAIKGWQIDDSSSKTREFIEDSRWEDLPTILISNKTKEFQNRFHIETAQKNGFSVRASGAVELFVCTGWSPRNYPCYYFYINRTEIFLSKYAMLPEADEDNSTKLESYKASSNIIADNEWRNFEISVDQNGKILLVDKNLNKTVIEHVDPQPLNPMYLLMHSNEPSVWKISENHFMFTRTTQISRMGPQVQATYKDLCISLFVATCSNCKMIFFYLNGSTKQILNYVEPTNDKWIQIKLKQENIQIPKFNIFVQTEFVNSSVDQKDGWWAYDDVRLCNENEVKVSFLKLFETFAEDDLTVDEISCQLIKKPSWRPTKLEYDEIKDFPAITPITNDTSIKLTWTQEDPDNYINYFIFYQGNDVCPSGIANSIRLKSTGFLSTKHNEITINNLVPFTTYNITVSSVLHENDKFLHISTLETDDPSLEELPIRIFIRPTSTTVNISWDQPPCSARHGRLIYTLIVSSQKYNFNKTMEYQVGNTFLVDGLQPFTSHTLTVLTARNGRMLSKGVHTHRMDYNFTTLAGVAPPVENLEVYAIGPNVAYLRYDLPTNSPGIPTEVQVTRCNKLSFAKCRAMVSPIERCSLWRNKFCVKLSYLMPKQAYIFKVSVKNTNTNVFGKEMQLTEYTVEKAPQPPQNITYRIVDCQDTIDYCHLNISWLHPYFPNGTIDSFNIILNSTKFNLSASEEDQTIHEVYKIVNETYLPRYTYQVKYVPYSTKYNLYIQSANAKYQSNFTSVQVKTADLGNHINQSPKLLGSGNEALVFKLPHLDRRLNYYTLTVVVQDFNDSVPVYFDSLKDKKVASNLCHPFGVTWISQVLKVTSNDTKNLTIRSLDEDHAIKPNTQYCVIFIVTNNYRGEEHDVVYREKLTTASAPAPPQDTVTSSSYNHLYMLLLLLLLVPVGFLIFRCIRKRKVMKLKQEQKVKENEYESLPFEDHDGNAFNNRTYDQLIHK